MAALLLLFTINFAVSGALKLRAPSYAVDLMDLAAKSIGVSLKDTASLVRVFAIAELAIGFSLASTHGPLLAVSLGLAAVAFLSFVAVSSLARRAAISCGCYGRLSTREATWCTVIRNVACTMIATASAAWVALWGGTAGGSHLRIAVAMSLAVVLIAIGSDANTQERRPSSLVGSDATGAATSLGTAITRF